MGENKALAHSFKTPFTFACNIRATVGTTGTIDFWMGLETVGFEDDGTRFGLTYSYFQAPRDGCVSYTQLFYEEEITVRLKK